MGGCIVESLHQDEIRKLEDELSQLQYLLGGLNSNDKIVCKYNNFWSCDKECSCVPVPNDERLDKVVEYIKKHNISNETFMRLVLSYLQGYMVKYNGQYGELFLELDEVLADYKFNHSTVGRVAENNLKEKELIELLNKQGLIEGSLLNRFLKKYSLTETDFMVLAKTSINYNYNILRGFERKDLLLELKQILQEFDLYESFSYVILYRKRIEIRQKELEEKNKCKSLWRCLIRK